MLNDYITLGMGEFLTPSNVFVERQTTRSSPGCLRRHSAGEIDRFPSARWISHRTGPRANYAFYVSNGPTLNDFDAATAGTLEFNDFSDNNDNKAFGGGVGFLPILGVEAGYGFETAMPGTQGTSFARVPVLLQSVDLNITRDSYLLKGRVDLHAQYAWSRVGSAVYAISTLRPCTAPRNGK